ncbi:murein biosynthesis integral membrane protein MurJ [uncultured Victivallis sp.]|uniref:murein biosynthesis integral membrane protein MurJ n=1 Tax=uncultured Victivallis sp. TaxID=354118 RepID=UPI0025829A87|nr:murein biosynthesis integral membrane protein MurJ [uncultured Victivallis sp.]
MAHARQTGFLKSSLGVAFATLLSRALGLVRVMFEARVLGGGSVASAWFLAFSIPNLFRRLLGEGALGTALIPLVAQAEAEHGPDKVRRDLGVVFAVLSLILALVVALIAGGALGLRAFARSETGAAMFPLLATERMQLVLAILPLLMPYAFFICLVGVVGAVLNTRKEFVLPALGALLLNFFLIGGLGWGYYRAIPPAGLPQFLNVLSFLVLGSGALQLVLMLLLLWYHGRFPSLKRESFRDCAILKQLWKLVLPGMIGGAALQISFLVDRMLAIWLGPQAVPALNNVDRIVDLPIGIFALALGSVLMANMAQAAARGSREELAEDLVFSLRHVYFVCIPMAVLVMLFWQPLIRMLCLGGNYTESDLEATRYVAIFYGAGIPSFCVLKVVLPVYYARKMMKIPLYSSLISIACNIILNLCLMWTLKQGGIALSTVLASMLNNTILITLLHREGFNLQGRLMLLTGLRSLLLAGAVGVGLYFLYPQLRRMLELPWFGEFPAFVALMALFGGLYFGASFLLRAAEPREFFDIVRRRKKTEKL